MLRPSGAPKVSSKLVMIIVSIRFFSICENIGITQTARILHFNQWSLPVFVLFLLCGILIPRTRLDNFFSVSLFKKIVVLRRHFQS